MPREIYRPFRGIQKHWNHLSSLDFVQEDFAARGGEREREEERRETDKNNGLRLSESFGGVPKKQLVGQLRRTRSIAFWTSVSPGQSGKDWKEEKTVFLLRRQRRRLVGEF